MKDARHAIVAWAKWLAAHHNRCVYSEGPNRYANLNRRGILPYVGDCSSTVRNYYNWAGALDPYRLGYGVPEGYTGTELAVGAHIDVAQVLPGDAVVYGPGTGWHTALVVERVGENILTISMGQQGDPSYVWVRPPTCPSRGHGCDGREPVTFLRFSTLARRIYWPPDDSPEPLPQVLRHMNFVRLSGPCDRWLASRNGWPVWTWDGHWFAPAGMTEPPGTQEYANAKFATTRQ